MRTPTPKDGEIWLIASIIGSRRRTVATVVCRGPDTRNCAYRVSFLDGDRTIQNLIDAEGWLGQVWFQERVMTPRDRE